MKKISNISYEETEEILTYNLPDIPDGEHYTVTGKKINWEKLYGVLDEGEYAITFNAKNSFPIKIYFTINENGEAEIGKIDMY